MAIEVDGVRVAYRLDRRLRLPFSRKPAEARKHVAVSGVSFTVCNGEIFGIVGRNGAGKSTLVRAVAGVLPIDAGRIVIRGSHVTLLSLGLGFNTYLTGRENIILGGLAAGRSLPTITEQVPDIASFSGLGSAIDRPVRTYSTGMRGRLAFSVAIHAEPGIMLVDEALAAGDMGFSARAFARMRELVDAGHAGVIVSHSVGQIREMTRRSLWLRDGEVAAIGDTPQVMREYSQWVKGNTDLS